MKYGRRILTLVTALLLVFSCALSEGWRPAAGNRQRFQAMFKRMRKACEEPSVGGDGRLIYEIAAEIRAVNADDGDIAQAIADHWWTVFLDDYPLYIHHGEETARELEESESAGEISEKHAIVVLGYRLENGEMTEELIGRCRAAAAAARSWPSAILVCTGGATGTNNPEKHTEAGEMKKYLTLRCGIDASRVFTDTQAMTTIENARNTLVILKERGIETITIVTSDYHQAWGQVLYNALAAMEEKNSGYTFRIVGNYNYHEEHPQMSAHTWEAAISQLSSMEEFRAPKE